MAETRECEFVLVPLKEGEEFESLVVKKFSVEEGFQLAGIVANGAQLLFLKFGLTPSEQREKDAYLDQRVMPRVS